MSSNLHPTLPPLPSRIARLPVDARGFPVPWFVQWFHADGEPFEEVSTPIHPGDYPDFRVTDARKMAMAYKQRLCWVCGGPLGGFIAFVIGPMCAINRVSGEPPSHRDCAEFSVKACPFLTKPLVVRRENDLPATHRKHPQMLDRNPGVSMIWVTRTYSLIRPGAANEPPLFEVGEPLDVMFYREGRPATRDEIMASITSGMPFLREEAEKEGAAALDELKRLYDRAIQLVPAA